MQAGFLHTFCCLSLRRFLARPREVVQRRKKLSMNMSMSMATKLTPPKRTVSFLACAFAHFLLCVIALETGVEYEYIEVEEGEEFPVEEVPPPQVCSQAVFDFYSGLLSFWFTVIVCKPSRFFQILLSPKNCPSIALHCSFETSPSTLTLQTS